MYATLLLVFLAAASGFPSQVPQECMEEVQQKYAKHLTLTRGDVQDHKEIMKKVMEQIDMSKCGNVHFRVVFNDDDTEPKNDNVSNKPPRGPEPVNEKTETIPDENSKILERYADRLKEEDDEYILNVNREEPKPNNNQRKPTENKQNSENYQKETHTTNKEAQQNYFTTERINRLNQEEGYSNIDEEDNKKEKYDDVETEEDTVKRTYGRQKTNYQTTRPPYRNKRRPTNRYPSRQSYKNRQSDDTYSDESGVVYEDSNEKYYGSKKKTRTTLETTTTTEAYVSDNEEKNKFANRQSSAETTNVNNNKFPVEYQDDNDDYQSENEDNEDNKRKYDSTKTHIVKTETATQAIDNEETKKYIDSVTENTEKAENFEKNKYFNPNKAEKRKYSEKSPVEYDDDDKSENEDDNKKQKYDTTKTQTKETEATTQGTDNVGTKKTTTAVTENTEQAGNFERHKYFNPKKARESNSDETQTRPNPQNIKNKDEWEIINTTENAQPDKNYTTNKNTEIIFGSAEENFKNNRESDTISNKQNVNHGTTKEISATTEESHKKVERADENKDNKDTSTVNSVTETSKVTTNNELTTRSETKQDKITDEVQTEGTIDHVEKKGTVSDASHTNIQTLNKPEKENVDSEPKLQNSAREINQNKLETEKPDSQTKLQNNDQEVDKSKVENSDQEKNSENQISNNNIIHNDHGDQTKTFIKYFTIFINFFKTLSEWIFSIIRRILSYFKLDGKKNV